MTGYTPIYNLPYPQASDLVSAYPGTGQDLAEEVETVLAAKAPLASPTFTGTPLAPTAANGTNTTQIATTAFVQSAGGLVLVSPTSIANSGGSASASNGQVTFSGITTVSLNGCFSATYDNYLLLISLSSTNVTTLHLRVRASGTDLSTNTYYNTRTSGAGTLAASMTLAAALGNAERCGSSVTIIGPYQAQQTNAIVLTDQTAGYDCYLGSSGVRNTTAYDGFTLFPGAGSITGTVRVYGYKNS